MATPAALEVIHRLSAAQGPLMFFQSGGCCDGSSPMCLKQGELPLSPHDVRLGEIAGIAVLHRLRSVRALGAAPPHRRRLTRSRGRVLARRARGGPLRDAVRAVKSPSSRSSGSEMRVGILTGGGDCPGLNAVIRAVVRGGIDGFDDEIVGFRDGWRGRARELVRRAGHRVDARDPAARRHDPRQLAHEPVQARRRRAACPRDARRTPSSTR